MLKAVLFRYAWFLSLNIAFTTSIILAGHNKISLSQCSVLHQNGSNITTTFIKGSFNYRSAGCFFRIGFQVQANRIQVKLYPEVRLHSILFWHLFPGFEICRPSLPPIIFIAASCSFIFSGFAPSLSILLSAKTIGTFCSLRMRNCFFGLRHYGIICSNHNHSNIGDFCTTGTHGRKRFVTRSIEESNSSAIL